MVAIASSFDLPAVEDELDRKAIETLEMLLLKRDQGKITEAQFDTGLDILFSVAGGIVREDFAELISQAAEDINRSDPSFEQRRLFAIEGSIFYMRVNVDQARLKLSRFAGGKWTDVVKDYSDHTVPEKALKKQVAFVSNNMTDKGYEEI